MINVGLLKQAENVYSRNLADMDYHGLSWTDMDCHGLSWTILDWI